MAALVPGSPLADPGASTNWIKSSLSFSNSNCVQVANLPGGWIGVRDSKDPTGPVLHFTPGEWHAFLGGVRNGEFDSFDEALSPPGTSVIAPSPPGSADAQETA